jgi:hypothetical protein
MAVVMAVTAVETAPAYHRLTSSAQNFRQYFRDLGKSGVSPMERFVFSLMLANSKTPKAEMGRR